MAEKKTPRSVYIKKILKKFPDTPTMTLAKKAYKEQPLFFESVENARQVIRYHRGLSGEKNRGYLASQDLVKEPTYNYAPFHLPESKSEPANVWKLPRGTDKVLILSDIHFPYQDNDAIRAALKYGKDQNINGIYINGDMLDFYQLSFHEKDPRVTPISEELEMGRQFLAMLRKEFVGVPIFLIIGNHEYRLERYLRVKAPELLDMSEFRIDVLLKCGEYGVTYIPYRSKCYMGKLLVEHGDKVPGAGGVNPARTALLKFKRPILVGHFHRTTQENSSVYDDDAQMAWSVGCLCTLEPSYMPVNNHNHGFAIVNVDHSTGEFSVDNKIIINGKVY